MAKFLATGLRLAWVTAHPDLARQLARTVQASSLGACSLTQAIAARLLGDWGDRGLHAHLLRVQGLYARRAAVLHAAASQHLAGLAEWEAPTCGMFMVRRGAGVHGNLRDLKLEDSECCCSRRHDISPTSSMTLV